MVTEAPVQRSPGIGNTRILERSPPQLGSPTRLTTLEEAITDFGTLIAKRSGRMAEALRFSNLFPNRKGMIAVLAQRRLIIEDLIDDRNLDFTGVRIQQGTHYLGELDEAISENSASLTEAISVGDEEAMKRHIIDLVIIDRGVRNNERYRISAQEVREKVFALRQRRRNASRERKNQAGNLHQVLGSKYAAFSKSA